MAPRSQVELGNEVKKAQAWLAHFQNNVYTTIHLLVSYGG